MPSRANGNLGAMYDLLINRIVIPILLTISIAGVGLMLDNRERLTKIEVQLVQLQVQLSELQGLHPRREMGQGD